MRGVGRFRSEGAVGLVGGRREWPRTAPRLHGELSLEGVSFEYRSDSPVLRSVDLRVSPGQTVALTGPAGAGKTTLLTLVARLREPTEGVVRIDGQDVSAFTRASLQAQVRYVPCDSVVFRDLRYGARGRPWSLDELIASLPEGRETVVGERGVNLSGGLRQAFAIAAELVGDAPIVLLDEPTASLDPESEELVLAAFDRLLAGRTVLVVTHRPDIMQRAD